MNIHVRSIPKSHLNLIIKYKSLFQSPNPEQILSYSPTNPFIHFRQANDKISNQDSSAIKEGKKLFEDKVEAISYSNVNDCFFFCGSVEAAMKKRLSYSIKFAMTKNSDIVHSSCECPAGMGPHSSCKHVTAGNEMWLKFSVLVSALK